MARPYRTKEAQIAGKVEATPGTAETLTGTEMFIAQNVKVTPKFADTQNEGLTGVLSNEPGVSGMQTGEISFDVVLKGSGVAGTAPEWRVPIMSCGFSETIVGGVSVTYKPAAPESYFTYGLMLPGLGAAGEDMLFRLAGCQANGKLSCKTGGLFILSVTAQGVWVDPTDTSVLTPPTWQTSVPYAFLAPAMTFQGVAALAFETLEIDFGNDVQIRPNANSAKGALTAQIVNRRVTGSVDFELEKLATFNLFSKVGTDATGAISMTPIGTAGNLINLSLPKIRFMDPGLGDRNSVATTPAKFEALRSANAGNDEVSIALT
jgi:hypothetical protein